MNRRSLTLLVVLFVMLASAPPARPQKGSCPLGVVVSNDGVGGVKITEAMPNSPAAQAGLVVGDIIMAIDGNAVKSEQALDAELASRKPGSKVTVTFMHTAWVMKATVTSDSSLGIRVNLNPA